MFSSHLIYVPYYGAPKGWFHKTLKYNFSSHLLLFISPILRSTQIFSGERKSFVSKQL